MFVSTTFVVVILTVVSVPPITISPDNLKSPPVKVVANIVPPLIYELVKCAIVLLLTYNPPELILFVTNKLFAVITLVYKKPVVIMSLAIFVTLIFVAYKLPELTLVVANKVDVVIPNPTYKLFATDTPPAIVKAPPLVEPIAFAVEFILNPPYNNTAPVEEFVDSVVFVE